MSHRSLGIRTQIDDGDDALLGDLNHSRFFALSWGASRPENRFVQYDHTAYCLLCSSEPSGCRQEGIEAMRRSDERRDGNWGSSQHFHRTESLTIERGDLASCLGGDDDPRGDVVGVFAEQSGRLKPIGGQERLLATGAPQVAEPAR
jgi:hypothetical protein